MSRSQASISLYLIQRTVLIGGSVAVVLWLSLVLLQEKQNQLNPPKILPTHTSAKERGFNPKTLLPPVRPIIDAPIISADQIGDSVSDNELVMGVVVNGKARAYPINMLCGPRREIINDNLGQRAIAATW